MSTPKFKIHYNREMGKKYYSERDYVSDMKKSGVEPYDPSKVKKKEWLPYKESDWARSMKQDIKDRNGRPPGERFIKELEKRGHSQESANKARKLAGENR